MHSWLNSNEIQWLKPNRNGAHGGKCLNCDQWFGARLNAVYLMIAEAWMLLSLICLLKYEVILFKISINCHLIWNLKNGEKKVDEKQNIEPRGK